MKFSKASIIAACVPAIGARFIETAEVDNVLLQPDEKYLVETAPGETKWVTEEDKWEMRRVSSGPYNYHIAAC
jgi:leucyl aminopeptidase